MVVFYHVEDIRIQVKMAKVKLTRQTCRGNAYIFVTWDILNQRLDVTVGIKTNHMTTDIWKYISSKNKRMRYLLEDFLMKTELLGTEN